MTDCLRVRWASRAERIGNMYRRVCRMIGSCRLAGLSMEQREEQSASGKGYRAASSGQWVARHSEHKPVRVMLAVPGPCLVLSTQRFN